VRGGESNPPEDDGGRAQRQELFISYSHKDRDVLERFWTHLKPLEEDYGLQRWDDSRMRPGDIWLKEIEQALERAQVALLLVSPDFLASDFIRRKELPALFEAAEKDGLTILWLPIRPCSWKRHRQIEQYQSVGSLDPTLAEMDEAKRDREMVKITDRIHELFEQIQNERQAALRLANQEAQRQREETVRLARLNADREARAEAQRWKAEAERLVREKEEWQKQATSVIPQPRVELKISAPQERSLIQIPATRGWLVRGGKKWQKQEAAFPVPGYKEELAEGVVITMVQIPEGEYLMGSPPNEDGRNDDEGPQHRVRLPRFFMGQTPVTQAQWKVVAGWTKQERELPPDPSSFKGPNRPVEQVNWTEAIEFCKRLSQRSGKKYTLPSEAQWEYACRAGMTTPFHFGETLTSELANYDATYTYANGPKGEYRQQTTPVGIFPANAWGLQDMHGNVWEWCLDHWHASYVGAPEDGSAWLEEKATKDKERLLRGGSWFGRPQVCRSAFRDGSPPGGRDVYGGGFRVCCLPQD
jgi:formylglycine-generating enzyme required for sulfatase activity